MKSTQSSVICQNSSNPETKAGETSEPLRALRRGLTRAEGFALFVAVVKNPAQRNHLIKLLQEAIPGRKLQTVTLRADTTDILDEIKTHLGTVFSGPIMIVGLETAISAKTCAHPILAALNLRRTDWPQLIHQPVVFWVPEYLLGILGRIAPDFLDWRSDTLHFPEIDIPQLEEFLSSTWAGGTDTQMPVTARIERVKELESRLAANINGNDPVVLATVAEWLNELGLHLNLLGRLQEALNYFNKAIEIHLRLGNRDGESVVLSNIGNIYSQFGDFKKAREVYEKALQISRETHNRKVETALLGNLGVDLRIRGELSKAIQYFNEQLAKASEINDRRSEGNALSGLALVRRDLGETDESIQLYEQALNIYREIGDRRNEGNIIGNLGVNFRTIGDLAKAIKYQEDRLVIVREIGDRRGEASALGNLGNAYNDAGDFHKAIEYFKQNLNISREMGDRPRESAALCNLGNAYANLTNLPKAMELYDQSITIAREVGELRCEAYGLWNSAITLYRMKDWAKATYRVEAALKLFEFLQNPLANVARSKLAEWHTTKPTPAFISKTV